MNYKVELGRLFKDRENIDIDESLIGDIISTNPISISILNNNAIFTQGDNLYICESLKSISGSIVLESVAEHNSIVTNFSITRELNVKDKVLCVPLSNGQKYVIIDKIL